MNNLSACTHTQEVLEERNRAFRVLSDTILEVEGLTEEKTFSVLCRNLRKICGATCAALASYRHVSGIVRLEAVDIDGDIPQPSIDDTLIGAAVIPLEMADHFKDKQVMKCEARENCFKSFFAVHPVLREVMSVDDNNLYHLSCVREGELLAIGVVQLPLGEKLRLKDLVNSYLSLSGVILQRVYAQQGMRESEARYCELVERASDAIGIFQDAIVKYVNSQSLGILGYIPEEVIGRPVSDFLHPNVLSEMIDRYIRRMTGEIFDPKYETTLVHKDGSRVEVELSTGTIMYEGRSADLVVIRDITERKRVEEERRRIDQQLQYAGRLAAVGELAAGVAHELNNPIAIIQMYAEFLKSRTDLDASARSDVEVIHREVVRSAKISHHLLSFASKHSVEKSFVSLNDVIGTSLKMHGYRLSSNNITVTMDLDPDLPSTMADFYQMQQVFVNIITNAAQAIAEVQDSGTFIIKTRRIGETIRISFTDDGPGIPQEIIRRIFDPFFTTKEVGTGTGLGLSICFGIVQEHSGHIFATSEMGKGATFTIEIPVVNEEQFSGGLVDTIQKQWNA